MSNAAQQTGNLNEQLLSVNEAAKVLGVVPHTLNVWRVTNRYNLPFIRIGRLIRYRTSDLLAWMESRRVAAS